MKKIISSIIFLALITAMFAGCSGGNSGTEATKSPDKAAPATDTANTEHNDSDDKIEEIVIRVGASPAPHTPILEVAQELLAEQGIALEIIEFDDYILPNTALEEGDLDANFFQHIAHMNNSNTERGTHLVSAASIHYEPLGIYKGKAKSLDELEDGASIAVPNDGTNEARALLLLEAQGLIKLREGVDEMDATKMDIDENPHNYEIVEMEAKLVSQVLSDVDFAVINGNYALDAGLKADDAVAFEDEELAEPYVNILAVRSGDESSNHIKALVSALTSPAVKEFIEKTYGSSVQPVF